MAFNMQKLLDKIYKDENNSPSSGIKYPDPIATPSPSINWALNGGIVPGSFYCFEGPPSGGKSFMALACVSEMLKKDPESVAYWFDIERTFQPKWLNIFLPKPQDQARLIIRTSGDKPFTGPLVFDYFADTLVGMMNAEGDDKLKICACVVDSITQIIPPKEFEMKSTEDHQYAALAGYLPKALRLITAPSKSRMKEGFEGVSWIFISQVRDNMDPSAKYTGQKYTIPGGKAYRHAIETEILFEAVEGNKSKIFDEEKQNMNEKKLQIGHRVRAKIEKNKLGPPKRVVEFDINYNDGFVNRGSEIAILGSNLGILNKEGNTYFFKGEKIAIGEEKMIKAINENTSLQNQIMNDIMETQSHEPIDSGRPTSETL